LPARFHQTIIDFLADQNGAPTSTEAMLERFNVAPEDHAAFQQTIAELMAAGRIVSFSGNMVGLPAMGNRVTGRFQQTSRGFGFVVPEESNAHGDLFIPAGENLGAVSGDYVAAKVVVRQKYDMRDKKSISGRIVEILRRATNQAVGTLSKQHDHWVIIPDGNIFRAPIEVQDVTAKSANEGDKVVVELIRFPQPDQPGQGVITEVLGARGEPEVELQSVIRQFSLPREFPAPVMQQARDAARTYDPAALTDRELLYDDLIITIDPDDARDFDDAISLKVLSEQGRKSNADAPLEDEEVEELLGSDSRQAGKPAFELGVHIADVANFVPVESAMDLEARARGNSIYFPRNVIPMLPEILSNGVCSLQEAQPRLTKTAWIKYDSRGNVVGTRFANTIIKSRKRLTYRQAQAVIDDAKGEGRPYSKGLLEAPPNPNVPEVEPDVRALLINMDRLARIIRQRRLAAGMIVLDLPEVELVMDAAGHVIDAKPEDDSFTHKIIEMFMVEANEAVSRFLTRHDLPVLRRIHPDPDVMAAEQVRQFMMVAGRKLPKVLDRAAIQSLLDSVRGTPIAYAVHLSVLKTFTTAEYSPLDLGHYALASDNYAHFTSPIRRYADLVIHRCLDAVLQDKGAKRRIGEGSKKKTLKQKGGKPLPHPTEPSGSAAGLPETNDAPTAKEPTGRVNLMPEHLGQVPDYASLEQLGKHLSFTERRAADAERELRAVKVLQLLAEHVGDVIDGVVTGITSFGVFVQSTRFLTEGLIRIGDLPDDFWQFDDRVGALRGQRSGRRISLGDRAKVQIVSVNIPARQLELRLLEHGSATGGDTSMRRMEPRKFKPPHKHHAERDGTDGEQPARNKNISKRLARKLAARQAAKAPKDARGPNRGRGRGRGRR
jgi:ribonuclease R